MRVEPYLTIERTTVGHTELKAAINKLGPPANDPFHFWTRIANDFHYSSIHRRSAVFQLFRRHVHVGMTLSALVRVLDRPTWFRSEDIELVEILGGKIPVNFVPEDTVFVIRVLPAPEENTSAIYLRVVGKVDLQSFKDFVLSKGQRNIGNLTIAQIGFSEF